MRGAAAVPRSRCVRGQRAHALRSTAAVILQYQVDGSVDTDAGLPWYVAAVGGLAIVVGLATWGYRVMKTVGEKITPLSRAEAFSAQFGAAVSVLIATLMGLPISTTSVLIGSISGVGLVTHGRDGVDVKLLG